MGPLALAPPQQKKSAKNYCKKGKSQKNENRSTLPRTETQLSSESTSSNSSNKYSLSGIELVKSVSLSLVPPKEVTVTNGDDGGHDHDQWTQLSSGIMAGLSMAQLNNLLATYIKTVREMENQETSTESRTISVSIDYSEIQLLDDSYKDEFKNWQNQLADKDKIISDLKAKIAKLELDIKIKIESLDKKDKDLREKEKIIADLRMEVEKLTAEIANLKAQLEASTSGFGATRKILDQQLQRAETDRAEMERRLSEMTSRWTEESRRVEDIRIRLEEAERNARFKMNILEGQLKVERELTLRKSQFEISAVNQRFKGEYDTRLQEEINLLRRIYEQSMRANKVEMEALYMKKIREYEEVQEARYESDLLAKRTQIKHLMERNQELEKMWMETRDRIKVDTLELVNYRELLTPEYDRKMNIRASASMNSTMNESMISIGDTSFQNSSERSIARAEGSNSSEMNTSKAHKVKQEKVVVTQKTTEIKTEQKAKATKN